MKEMFEQSVDSARAAIVIAPITRRRISG